VTVKRLKNLGYGWVAVSRILWQDVILHWTFTYYCTLIQIKNDNLNRTTTFHSLTLSLTLSHTHTLQDDNGQEVTERIDSLRIAKREQQIHLHTQRKSKRRQRIAAKKIDISNDNVDAMVFPKSEHERDFLEEALEENFIFSDLSDKERNRLIDAMQKQVTNKGSTIIKQGDVGDFFYIVEQGVVNFYIEGTPDAVGSCSNGESFGELALLYDAPRAATCIAAEATTLWKVDQNTFRVLLARQQLSREETIVTWLKKVPLFGHALTDAQLRKFCETLTPVKFSAGERIVNKGDSGDIFYIISEGKVKVHDIGIGDSQGVIQTYSQGDYFGERALITGEPRAANVTAITDVMTEATDRATFERCFGPFQSLMDTEMKKRFLKGLPIFNSVNISDKDLDSLVKLLKETTYEEGTKLAEEGRPRPQSLWIVKSGEIVVYDNKGQVYHLNSGDYYGDNSVRFIGHWIACQKLYFTFGLTGSFFQHSPQLLYHCRFAKKEPEMRVHKMSSAQRTPLAGLLLAMK